MDERTTEILRRFSESWTATEIFIDDLISNYPGFEKLVPVRSFITSLRQNGYDKYFRLGTSMHVLVISRSVNHGLRLDQKHIKIESFTANDFEIIFCQGNKVYRKYIIKSLDDTRLTNLLRTLQHTLVD